MSFFFFFCLLSSYFAQTALNDDTHVQQSESNVQETAQYFCTSLHAEPSLALLKNLRMAVASKPIAWIQQFSNSDGIRLLGNVMTNVQRKATKYADHSMTNFVYCVFKPFFFCFFASLLRMYLIRF